jgi:hypothetical protein
VRDGRLGRAQINDFLQRLQQRPYQPRLRVSYTITGTFDIDPDDVDAHADEIAERIAVDLDPIDGLVAGSHTEQVTVTSMQRVDPDRD